MSFIHQMKNYTVLFILFFLSILIIIFSTGFLSFNRNSLILNISITENQIFIKGIQPTIITPTFYSHSPYVEILDFILYKHPTSIDEYSIYFSGRRHSWTWSDIYCFFTNSNESAHGSIDRRSEEPFVLCPLPSFAQKLLFNGNSQLNLSLRIHDKSFPNTSLLLSNITVPIYHRNRYNVSIYTMICNRTEVLVEWIEYHLLIGVEHFYLYDHFSTDNLNYFLRSYLERQLVTIIRWPYRPLKGHHWNMMQSASMNHALKTFGSFNRWMGYFDVDEYFQIIDPTKLLNHTISLSDFLDQNFPESTYPGGVQFRNCPISCLFDEVGIASSRYRLLFEKCRHIHSEQDCQSRTKMFIRPRHVPIMQNIHALEHGIQFASSSQSSSLAQFRHYHYGVMLITMSENDTIDRSMDIFIDELKKRIISYL